VSEQPSGSARKREVKELEGKGVRGVVTRVGRAAIWIACDGEGEETERLSGKRMWVVKMANEVTYKRYVLHFCSFPFQVSSLCVSLYF
jgi:DNA polymerase alpha-associated DNA helicase A